MLQYKYYPPKASKSCAYCGMTREDFAVDYEGEEWDESDPFCGEYCKEQHRLEDYEGACDDYRDTEKDHDHDRFDDY